ncbi:MAG: sulfide/dihydroorotate dehydrogenase-like FAD/NAD-binding protein [Verrucomicrobiota bacterium]|nr:sulfide/dihydroorotate dehydrogenase-like FAD/NAD-binding protein [Limisphaera sp.]MDW8381895.1 sulfide/dihydroorotate dehydrogenase-like FAD/NAD-binding protein [Verrucomicrobiota bacterium]
MYTIVEAKLLAPQIKLFRIEAPATARRQRPGQFVIVRVHKAGERIPLTVSDSDPHAATIPLIVQGVGKTTRLLNEKGAGDFVLDVVGSLGKPSEIMRFGAVVVIGGGVGAAIAYPTARALKQAGNHVTVVLGARSRDFIILEQEMRSISDRLSVTTNDGSYSQKGLVTDALCHRLTAGPSVNYVLAIGPIRMMAAAADVTRPFGIRTVVSVNPIMVDGTGMCGGCRIQVGTESRFACVDGPEFDARRVNVGRLVARNTMYRQQELRALQEWERARSGNGCRLSSQGASLEPGDQFP